MKFRNIPLGGCFRLGRSKAIHRKNSDTTYFDDSVGDEITLAGTKNVRAVVSCPTPKALIELGNAKKR